VAPSIASQEKLTVRRELSGAQEQLTDALLAVRQAVSHKCHVAGERRVRRHGMMCVRVEPVVDAVVCACAEAQVSIAAHRTTAIGEDGVVARDIAMERIFGVLAQAADRGGSINIPEDDDRTAGQLWYALLEQRIFHVKA